MSTSSVISLTENGRARWVSKVIDCNTASVHFVMQVSKDRSVITHFVCLGIVYPLKWHQVVKRFCSTHTHLWSLFLSMRTVASIVILPKPLLLINKESIAFEYFVFPCLLGLNTISLGPNRSFHCGFLYSAFALCHCYSAKKIKIAKLALNKTQNNAADSTKIWINVPQIETFSLQSFESSLVTLYLRTLLELLEDTHDLGFQPVFVCCYTSRRLCYKMEKGCPHSLSNGLAI